MNPEWEKAQPPGKPLKPLPFTWGTLKGHFTPRARAHPGVRQAPAHQCHAITGKSRPFFSRPVHNLGNKSNIEIDKAHGPSPSRSHTRFGTIQAPMIPRNLTILRVNWIKMHCSFVMNLRDVRAIEVWVNLVTICKSDGHTNSLMSARQHTLIFTRSDLILYNPKPHQKHHKGVCSVSKSRPASPPQVSWIRQRDIHILTVGRYTYTTDERYEVIHSQGSKDWILKIKYAQSRDSGNYECQVSTKPVKSYTVHLHVFAPKVEIIGSPDMHVDTGSTINLTCVIAHSPEPPSYIFWYHNDQVVNYESPRGSVSVLKEEDNVSRSSEAQPSDTGNYTCSPSNADGTSLRVHVFSGDPPAAMQTNGGVALLAPPFGHAFYTCLVGGLFLTLLTEDLLLPGTFRGGGVA
ncbi:uncharacterized protein LOC119585359 [Penaeus monodon]|uniref:uncharacterized protein LOC119585359 n=1 Tax=Penaeus monodon TaxID=6687 RepID=UPI0018A770A1|nr:uncharacterized protein LOC119585359 [Penaeus monodon]